MKNYVKPLAQYVELRPEERLANCGWSGSNPSPVHNNPNCTKGPGGPS